MSDTTPFLKLLTGSFWDPQMHPDQLPLENNKKISPGARTFTMLKKNVVSKAAQIPFPVAGQFEP